MTYGKRAYKHKTKAHIKGQQATTKQTQKKAMFTAGVLLNASISPYVPKAMKQTPMHKNTPAATQATRLHSGGTILRRRDGDDDEDVGVVCIKITILKYLFPVNSVKPAATHAARWPVGGTNFRRECRGFSHFCLGFIAFLCYECN